MANRQTVRYTVEREGRPVVLEVPLYSWPGQVIVREVLSNLSLWAAMLLAAVGWFVFFKRPGEWAAHPLLLFSICLLANNISTAVVDWSLPELLTPAIFPIAIFFSNWIFAVVMFPSLMLLTLLFPRPKRFVQQHPRAVLALFYGPVPLLIITFGSIAIIGWVSVLTMALLSLVFLAHSFFTVRDPVGRAQMRWAVGGLTVVILGFIPLNLSGLGWLPFPFPLWLEEIWFPVMLVIMALGFGMAILRYRLFDIDIIINRTLVYGTLTASIVAIYIFVVGYLGAIFRVEEHLLISLVATGVAAVLFQPLRQWLQRGVNRLMYGRRDEPVTVLTQLGQRLETAITPEEMLPGLVETVAQALKLPYAAIALKNEDQFEIQAETGRPDTDFIAFPLIYQGETIGQLRVAPRAPGEVFNPADQLLLENIARQAGAAAYSVRLTTALRHSRQQLVTAREEERRRLRRDLHDGLVPAIRESLKQFESGGLRLTVTATPILLPPLPAAVEVAAYHIIREAVTNVARHARAGRCQVQLNLQNGYLALTIVDDGCGLPPERVAGVGLASMRERAEELGGQMTIESQTQGGTRVAARLPLGK